MTELATQSLTLDKRQILGALRAFRRGDFSVRMPMELTGIDGEIAEVFNDIIELDDNLADELKRVRKAVGDD